MSLSHEFFLLSKEIDLNNRYEWYSSHRFTWSAKLALSDDLILFLTDFLNWIPSHNPETKTNGHGLNYYGTTVIYKNGADKLINILDSLVSLFEEAPDKLTLRGRTEWYEEDDVEGYCRETRVLLSKKAFLGDLIELKKCCIKVIRDDFYLLHFGI